jgi:signal transduction histidine kinase
MHASSSGIAGTPSPAPGNASARTKPRPWVLSWLDLLILPGAPHELAPGDLSRYRVAAITAGALALMDVLLLLSLPATLDPRVYRAVASVAVLTMTGHAGVLVLLRTQRSPRPGALLLCTLLSTGYIAANLALRNPYAAMHVAIPLITLLAFFLLGARGGFVFAAVMSLYALFLQPLSMVNPNRLGPFTTFSTITAGDIFAALCIMGVWWLSWLHSRARDQAQAALEQTLARLGEVHGILLDTSRKAGMAEIATGVLHNVGNTLNSVNVSANLVRDGLRELRISKLARTAGLLRQHTAGLPHFLTSDPVGKRLPEYLQALSEQLGAEQAALVKEMGSLHEALEHLKSIVSMQQRHARTAGAVEQVAVPQLIDEALRLHAVSFERLGIRLERDYAEVPPLFADRHKLLQILINLLSNAQHALVESSREEKRLCIRVRLASGGEWLRIEVEDNGVGITPENQRRLFTQGFTTKKTGHGFGLHISALSATDLKGRLSGTSPGPGQGATFTLELPLAPQEATP